MTPYVDPMTSMSRVYVAARIYDNKKLLEADPRYLERLKAVGDDALVRAWLERDWDALVGSFFTIKREEVMVEPFDIPPDWQLFAGMDYGETNATAAWLAAIDYDDTVHMVSTYHQADRSASQHAEAILKMIDNCPWTMGRRPASIYCDPSMFVKRRLTPVNEHLPADVFADVGFAPDAGEQRQDSRLARLQGCAASPAVQDIPRLDRSLVADGTGATAGPQQRRGRRHAQRRSYGRCLAVRHGAYIQAPPSSATPTGGYRPGADKHDGGNGENKPRPLWRQLTL